MAFDRVDVEDDDAGENSVEDEEECDGNYFGRAANAPMAPIGANPFASSSTMGVNHDDDIQAQIAKAKAQCDEMRTKRDEQERKEREKERAAFERLGKTYVERVLPGKGEDASATSERRPRIKARRPRAIASDAFERTDGVRDARANEANARDGLSGNASKASVFSRLSAKANAVGVADVPTTTTTTTTTPATMTYGFFAPPPVLTKANAETQRAAREPLQDDERSMMNVDERRAKKTTKKPSALAIELGLV